MLFKFRLIQWAWMFHWMEFNEIQWKPSAEIGWLMWCSSHKSSYFGSANSFRTKYNYMDQNCVCIKIGLSFRHLQMKEDQPTPAHKHTLRVFFLLLSLFLCFLSAFVSYRKKSTFSSLWFIDIIFSKRK